MPTSSWCAEAFFGILNLALITGVVFARFSRPYRARVVLQRGGDHRSSTAYRRLMFRAANQRGNQILDANITVTFAYQQTTREGIDDAPLRRTEAGALALAAVRAVVDGDAPHRRDTARFTARRRECPVGNPGRTDRLLSGTDETLSETIFARHSYKPHHIRWNHHFADVLSIDARGRRVVNLTRFHDTVADADVLVEQPE